MNEPLPDEFDVIIVGTGLSESILSGAFSRIGKKVLHLDHCRNYGSNWSSFNLSGFESWIEESNKDKQSSTVEDIESKIDSETEQLVLIKSIRKTIDQGETICYLNDEKKNLHDVAIEDCDKGDDEESQAQDKSSQIDVEDASSKKVVPDDSGSSIVTSPEEPAESEQKMEETTENKEDEKAEADSEKQNVTVEYLSENTGILKKSPKKGAEKVDEHSGEFFYSKWRHYNLDLAPKLMFSRGKLVELLIASNVCRYLEFRNVTSTLTLLNQSDSPQKLAPVPCSRTDIFNSKLVSMVEKRMLMKVLTICANFENHPEECRDFEERPFLDFLAAKKLSKKLQHFIIHSIAMVTEDTSTMEGLKASQKFLRSLGRYGNSAFLWTTYGVGELPQAFCRLGAVFGGTFCLSRSVKGIVVNKTNGRCIAVIDSTGQRIKCDHLILNECYAPESCRIPFSSITSRAIYVTDSSFSASNGNVSLITIPPTQDLPPTRLIEVGPSCCVCPPKLYVVHGLTSSRYESAKLPSARSQFSSVETIVFDGTGYAEKESDSSDPSQKNEDGDGQTVTKAENPQDTSPRLLWAAYFNMLSGGVDPTSLPENVLVTKGPGIELGFDETITEARSLFEMICPDEEFLPRAPNPDEIIYFDQNDEGYSTETNGNNSTSQRPEEIGEYQEDENEDAGTGEPSELEESTVSSQAASDPNAAE